MDRRGVLAALTPLLAGCFGGGAVSRAGTPGGSTPATTATAEPTETATAEPTEPTETATATPESAGTTEAAADRIETARARIGTAVDAYADSGRVADVDADADGFVPGDVYAALVRATSAASRAAALAATDEQAATARRLEGVIAFLTRATAAQANVIDGYDALVAARAALADGDPDEATDRRAEAGTARETAERALSHLTSEADAGDMAAVEVLDADDYRTKREQFDAATTALADAAPEVSAFANALELLSVARSRGENGNWEAAAADATEAEARFADVASTFADLAADVPRAASAFEDLFASFADLADEQATAAADVRAEYE